MKLMSLIIISEQLNGWIVEDREKERYNYKIRWIDTQIDWHIKGKMEGWMNGGIHGWMLGWMNGREKKNESNREETKAKNITPTKLWHRYLEELHRKGFQWCTTKHQLSKQHLGIAKRLKLSSSQTLIFNSSTSNKNKLEMEIRQSSRNTRKIIISHAEQINVDTKCYCSNKQLE